MKTRNLWLALIALAVFAPTAEGQFFGIPRNVARLFVTIAGTIAEPSFGLVSTLPVIELKDTDAAADEKIYQITENTGQLLFRTCDDAETACNNPIVIDRTGTTVDSVAVAATDLSANGTVTVTGTQIQISNAAPAIYVNETDSGGGSFIGFKDNGTIDAQIGISNATDGLCVGTVDNDVCIKAVQSGGLYFNPGTATTLPLTPQQGEFTATLDDGCTTSPTVEIDWQRIGNLVSMKLMTQAGTCTGDSTSWASTGTPVPSALRPTTSDAYTSGLLTGCLNNGTSTSCRAVITTAGNIAFCTQTTFGQNCGTTGWTASGNRSSAQPFQEFSYLLGDP